MDVPRPESTLVSYDVVAQGTGWETKVNVGKELEYDQAAPCTAAYVIANYREDGKNGSVESKPEWLY